MRGLDVEELGRTAWDGYGIENPVVRNQRVPEVQGYTGAGQGNERVVIPPQGKSRGADLREEVA
jgi:hypothetical protein